jgi:hypothetical protein
MNIFSKLIIVFTLAISGFAQTTGPIPMPPSPYPLTCFPPIPSCPENYLIDGQCLRNAMQQFHAKVDAANAEANERFNIMTLTYQATIAGATSQLNSCLSQATTQEQRTVCRSTFDGIHNLASQNYHSNTRTLLEETKQKLSRAQAECQAALTACCREG